MRRRVVPVSGMVEACDGGVVVRVHVQPRAGTTRVTGRHGDALKMRVAAPPVDGRATEVARRALAEALGVAPSTVSLVDGARSRLKRFRVDGLTGTAAAARIAELVDTARG